MTDTKVKLNRIESPEWSIFQHRGEDVKWPTLRGAYLTDDSVGRLETWAKGPGRSIIFLDGTYKTNLNKWVKKDPIERAVFFEFFIQSPKRQGAMFLLCWIGNFHNGSIFHCAYQYPQCLNWTDANGIDNAEKWLEVQAGVVYCAAANILYTGLENPPDSEVLEFARQLKVRRGEMRV